VTMHASRVVAAGELYIGLVEVGVGICQQAAARRKCCGAW